VAVGGELRWEADSDAATLGIVDSSDAAADSGPG
jgi:hypothetical protein